MVKEPPPPAKRTPGGTETIKALHAAASGDLPPPVNWAQNIPFMPAFYDLWHDVTRNHENAPLIYTNLPVAGQERIAAYESRARDLHNLLTPRFHQRQQILAPASHDRDYTLLLYLDPAKQAVEESHNHKETRFKPRPLAHRQHAPLSHEDAERSHKVSYFDPVLKLLQKSGASNFALNLYHPRGFTESPEGSQISSACILELTANSCDAKAMHVLNGLYDMMEKKQPGVTRTKGVSL